MRKIPIITIIGVPNTGKSTLFNRIIGKKKALVHSSPGMTRDIYKKCFDINNKSFYIQDSGGFFINNDIITDEINKRILKEAEVSDLIIFIFDGKRELLGYEKDLFLHIKKINSNIISVVNKVDNPEKFILPTSYYSLKLDLLYISSEHNLGFDELFEKIEKRFLGHVGKKYDEITDKARIAIVGKPNVGKSSIINKILNSEYVIVSPIPGTTRDSVDIEIRRKSKTFVLVDNAGIKKLLKVKESTESAAIIRAGKGIKNADVVIFVIDISNKIDQNDLFIAHKISKSSKPVIVALNKWDLVKNKEIFQSILSKAKRKLNFLYYASFIVTSAKTGKNVFELIDKVETISDKMRSKIKTSYINKVIRSILIEKKLKTEKNEEFNPKFIIIESQKPFFIKFHANKKHKLKPFFEVYLKKRILQELGFEGIPIFFKVSSKSSR